MNNAFYTAFGKRIFDIMLSVLALFILFPMFFLAAALIIIDSNGNPFFIQRRFGKDMKPFKLIKFRSMRSDPLSVKKEFDPGGSSRVTHIGRILRKTKFDELPELINVLKGDMSIVGPRPEVAKYIKIYYRDYKVILKNRPGLSDFASIKYQHEEMILACQTNPEDYYLKIILPDKLRLSKKYSENLSLKTDLYIIKKTIHIIIQSLQKI